MNDILNAWMCTGTFYFLEKIPRGTNLNQIQYVIGCKTQLSYEPLRKEKMLPNYDVINGVIQRCYMWGKMYITELVKYSCSKFASVKFLVVLEQKKVFNLDLDSHLIHILPTFPPASLLGFCMATQTLVNGLNYDGQAYIQRQGFCTFLLSGI